ncbi:protein phosphatase 1 regulatory subunit 3A [Echeneis naucrates]|uniref:protein phosphatase 1 regulatory subunit 3A n=1 Tax=Echeneis naucrates TaxID=173247 RepID=UPI001113C772|nr:protein phosphatase 1 regulatory subunit 3A-like [Echeneis naucrates]
MEFVGPPRLFEAWDLLGVPGLGSMDVDDDEGEMIIGIRPKCSPLPRRKSSVTDEDSEPELPLSGSRRVSFADAKGLSLVQVKEFDTWDVPTLRGYESSDSEGKEAEEYFLSLHSFSLPLSPEELCIKVQDQKVELESINLLPGTTILKGVIRVLNISFSKAVYIRTTLDAWSSHFDLLAEYIPGSSDGVMDCFSFKLTLVPPFGEQGARVDFSLRYETPVGTFWANNNNKNYVMFCRQRSKGKPQKDNIKKSCLKSVSRSFLSMDMSAVAGSPQDDISAVESKHGEGVNDKKTKELSDAQSAMSGEDGQKLQIENRCNSNRRSRRKAARLARVRDYFAQRDEGTKDTDKDESPLEAKQEVQEEKPKEKHLSPERSSKSGCSQFVCESFGTCIKSLPDSTSVSVLEKSERNNLAWQLSNLESSTDSPDSPPHSDDEPAPAECHNVNKPDSIPGEENSKQGDEFTNSTADEPVDSIVSAVISKSLIGQTPSFTFGTIVAPLYHQMFDRVGSESQSVADRGNPAQVTLTTEDLSHHPHTETKESRCPTLTEAGNVNDNVRGNIVKLQESNQDGSDANPSSPKEEESGLSLESDNLNQTDTLQDPGAIIQSDQSCTNTLSGSAEVYSHIVDIMHADLLRAKISTQRHQGDTQEHNKTCDHQHKITAETAQAQMTAGIHSQSKGQEVMTSPEASGRKISDEVNQLSSDSGENDKMEDNSGEIIKTKSTATASSEADNSLEALQDLELTEINHSATKETTGCFHSISHCEIIGRNDYTTPEASLENQECRNVKEQTKLTNNSYECETKHSAESVGGGEAAESLIKEVMGNNRTPDDMFAELKDEYTSEDEPIIVSGEVETALLNEEEISSADNTEVKNWEMMVEEEEENMLTGQGEGKTISLKGELLTAAGENRTKPEGVAGVEDKEKGREEENEPESAQTSHDMAESDSDEEEVELYMHCLRAVHAGSQASKDRDMGFSVGKRPSVSRSKLLSTPMPSISESLDEEQQLSCQHPDLNSCRNELTRGFQGSPL